jgi:hypothetical protein
MTSSPAADTALRTSAHTSDLASAAPPAFVPIDLAALIRAFAIGAIAVVTAMVVVFAATGIGQDPLQYVHPPVEYASILARAPDTLRMAIGLDNVFIVLYASMFLLLAAWLGAQPGPRPAGWAALRTTAFALLAVSAGLDLLENMHFLTMIAAAVQGLAIAPAQIEAQVWASLVKFHASYLGLFLLGWVLPGDTAAARTLRGLLRWVQWPVGMLIYLTPASIAVPLVFARFTFFLVALALLARVVRPHGSGSGAPA